MFQQSLEKLYCIVSNPFKNYFERLLGDFVDVAKLGSLSTPVLQDILISNQKAEKFNKMFMQELPFDLHKATISFLKLSVPLSQILSQSVVIECRQAFIILKSKQNYSYKQYVLDQTEKEKLKKTKISEAEKKKGFFDDLIMNIFNKMEINVNELVIQIFFEEPDTTKENQFSILLKVKSIQKNNKMKMKLGSSIIEPFGMSGPLLEQSVSFNQMKQIEQTISLELNQISLHFMNKGSLDKPEYQNIDQSLVYPWQWPNNSHPSTFLIIEQVEGTLEISSFKSVEKEQIQKQTALNFQTPVQIQMDPYQIYLLQMCIKSINYFFTIKTRYAMDFLKGELTSPIVRPDLENIYQNLIMEDSFPKEIKQLIDQNKDMNNEDLLQSICDNHQSQWKHSQFLMSQSILYYSETSDFKLKVNTVDIKLFKRTPTENFEKEVICEYSRQWSQQWQDYQDSDRDEIKFPVGSYTIQFQRLDFVCESKNNKLSKLRIGFKTLSIFNQDIIKQQLQQSGIFQSVYSQFQTYLSPSFVNLNTKNMKLIEFKPIDCSYQQQLILYMGEDFVCKNLDNQPLISLEGLQHFPKGIRRDEIVQFFQGNQYGSGFSQTPLKNIVQDQNVRQFIQDIIELPKQEFQNVLQIKFDKLDNQSVVIQAQRILVSFSFQLLADLNNILFPAENISQFEHMLFPIQELPQQRQIQNTSEYKFDMSVGFVRVIWKTWKLGQNMEQYKKFSNEEILSMHNQDEINTSLEEPFGLIFEFDRLNVTKKLIPILEFFNFDILTYHKIESDQRIILNKLISVSPQLIQKQLDPYYLGDPQEGTYRQKPFISINEIKQSTQKTNDMMNLLIKTQFKRKDDKQTDSLNCFTRKQQHKFQILGEQRDLTESSTHARKKTFYDQINKFYQLIDAERQQAINTSHSSLNISAELPYLEIQVEVNQLKLLDRFLQIMLIQLERLDQGRVLLMPKEVSKPNPLMLWINELKNNMSIEVKVREVNFQINFGLKNNIPQKQQQVIIQPQKLQQYQNHGDKNKGPLNFDISQLLFERNCQAQIISFHLLGFYLATKINMETQLNSKDIRTDRMSVNLVGVAKDLIVIDPNQIIQHRDSIFLKLTKPTLVTSFDTYQLLQVQSCNLPSYHPSHTLMFSEGIQRCQNMTKNIQEKFKKLPPFLFIEFDFKKSEQSNLLTLQKNIQQTIDFRKIVLSHINLRVGDGEFNFLKASQQNLSNEYKELDSRLQNRKEQFQTARYITQNIGIKKIQIYAVSLSIPQIYSNTSFANNERLRNRTIRGVVQTGGIYQQLNSEVKKDQEKRVEYFYGDSWSVFCVDYFKFQMFLKKEFIRSLEPQLSIQGMCIDLWDLKVGFLVDSSIYKEYAEQDFNLKQEQFPYLLFQQPSFMQNNINMTETFEDSYLDLLGFKEIANIKQVHFGLEESRKNEFHKQSKIITSNFESINIHFSIDDLEPLMSHILYLESILKPIKGEKGQKEEEKQMKPIPDQGQKIMIPDQNDSLNELKENLIALTSIYKDQEDFVILVGETERWKKVDITNQFESVWEFENKNMDLFQFNIVIRSTSLTLSEGSSFNFKEQKLNHFGRKLSDFQVLQIDRVEPNFVEESQDFSKQPIMGLKVNKNYMDFEEEKQQPQVQNQQSLIRERQIGKDIKILTVTLTNIKSNLNILRRKQEVKEGNIIMVNGMSAQLDDIGIRLYQSKNPQKIISLLQKQVDNQPFIYSEMTTVENNSSYSCPRISIQLAQEINVILQYSFIDLYFDLDKQIKMISQTYDHSDWFIQNKEAVMKLHLISKMTVEEHSHNKQSFKIINQSIVKPWLVSCLQIHNFKLVLAIKTEQLNIGNFTKFQLINIHDFNNIEVQFVEICLNDLIPSSDSLINIKDIYLKDIETNQNVILEVAKQVPIVRSFISASQGVYQLFAYPIIYTLSGEGFVQGLSQGVKGFVGSVTEIGSNISGLFFKGAQTIVYLGKNK